MSDAPTMTHDERNRALYVRRFSVAVADGLDRGASILSADQESKAARAASMGRSNLRQLCQRYGLRAKPGSGANE